MCVGFSFRLFNKPNSQVDFYLTALRLYMYVETNISSFSTRFFYLRAETFPLLFLFVEFILPKMYLNSLLLQKI